MGDKKEELLPLIFNKFGEAVLPGAPVVTLGNGQAAIPQQLFYNKRTVENVECILSHISFCQNYPLFVFEENGHVFIQVGIVSHENYPPTNNFSQRDDKIVYGRKWFIEPHTPTSEVIQTAYLAINKVREHELREQLTVHFDYKQRTFKSTPFNTHIDLPLAAKHKDIFYADEIDMNPFNFEELIRQRLQAWTLGKFSLDLAVSFMVDRKHWLIGIALKSQHENNEEYENDIIVRFFPELTDEIVYFVTNQFEITSFFYELMNSYIGKAESYVANTFSYDGFKRFAHDLDPLDFAKFSIDTRVIEQKKTEKFDALFKTMSYVVDSRRAPKMATMASLRKKQDESLRRKNLEGYLPK